MPAIHTAEFKVRHYECDAYGHVNQANYLRYMQEAAFGASDAVGFTTKRYTDLGLAWLAYETEIQYLRPLMYGDVFTIKTWVADFRRVRSLRRYEFMRDGVLIARGSTDWVLIDTTRNFPTAVTPEIIAAYSQGEDVTQAPPRAPFPPAPPMPGGVFTMRRRAEWHEIDGAGHVNNAVYLNYISECGMQMVAHFGWPADRLREQGVGLVARSHQIEYKLAILYGEEIEVATWTSDVKGASALRHYTLRRASDNKLLARVRSEVVWLDLNTGQPTHIPDAFIADLTPNISG
jgi:acyl-CoA thioester hydrolase